MLQLRASAEGFELKNSHLKVTLGGSAVKLGELTVDSAGEYEAGGIEVVYGEHATLIVWERVQIVYVFADKKPNTFEKSQFSSCDVVIFDSSIANLGKGQLNEALETFDPKVVATGQNAPFAELFQSYKAEVIDSYKLADTGLPEEGRAFVLLATGAKAAPAA